MKTDNYWSYFWMLFGGVGLLVMGLGVGLFVASAARPNVAAVNAFYNPAVDPFDSTLKQGSQSTVTKLTGGYLYRESLPLGFTSWNWQATANWRSSTVVKEGQFALLFTTTKEGGGVGMNGNTVSLADYKSLSLWVNPTEQIGDLYIELYDTAGNSMGRQSLGWYASTGKLTPNTWQQIQIPLQNLVKDATAITGFSLSGQNIGSASVDAVQLASQSISHAVWVMPADAPWVDYDPLATSTPVTLPYSLLATDSSVAGWYSYYGVFKAIDGGVDAGPQPGKGNTDGLAVFKGGKTWSDYQVDATLKWGEISVFSILARFTDDQNYLTCAFSHYGDGIQVYQVKKGQSTMLAQSPGLAILDDAAWHDVSVQVIVQGSKITCSDSGGSVSATVPDASRVGSVGVESWDQNSFAAPHILKVFTVSAAAGGE